MKIVDGDFSVYRDEDAHIAAGEGPGVDLCDSEGTAWLAPFDWTCVAGTGYDPDTGTGFHAGYVTVIRGVWKEDLVEAHFCHGQANEVAVGQTGSKGDVIGHVGYSGTCIPAGPAGAHLHIWFRIFVDGVGWQRVTRPSDLLAEEEEDAMTDVDRAVIQRAIDVLSVNNEVRAKEIHDLVEAAAVNLTPAQVAPLSEAVAKLDTLHDEDAGEIEHLKGLL